MQALRANQVAGLHFRRQQVIVGYIVDFYCHRAGLMAEVDGPDHARRVEEDAARERALAGLGLRVLRVSNEDVLLHTSEVLERIAAAAEGWT